MTPIHSSGIQVRSGLAGRRLPSPDAASDCVGTLQQVSPVMRQGLSSIRPAKVAGLRLLSPESLS